MNLHQLRFAAQTARSDLNLTQAAKLLFTSQSGVSKGIIELEQELGVDIFVRQGKRLVRVTEAGKKILASIDVVLREVGNMKRIGDEFANQSQGVLSIAATHTQARYVLPDSIKALRAEYPEVTISLHQGSPEQVAQWVDDEVAQIGIATESIADHPGLVSFPCYDWEHYVVIPLDHPLASQRGLSLESLALYPLITYAPAYTGRKRIDATFAAAGLKPNVQLEAIDSDVIKTYVRLGLGVGIMAQMAWDNERDRKDLKFRKAGKLFGTNTSRIAFKRHVAMRGFVERFGHLLAPELSKGAIAKAVVRND
jgi:LysR family transcriptional regulator, cys regulon transcriptional activator